MGIRASVYCNCFAQNRTTPCPYPEYFRFDDLEGPVLDMDTDEHPHEHQIFQNWLHECCPHPGMIYMSVFIASWKGFRGFSDALYDIGEVHFKELLDVLPYGDEEGMTQPESADAMLKELEYFGNLETALVKAILVDTERGRDISMGSQIHGGALTVDRESGLDLGFDAQGFFVRDRWELDRELFRAMRVEQRLMHPETLAVTYTDLDSGRAFQCSVPFGKQIIGDDGLPRMYLQQFHIEQRQIGPGFFSHITDPLTRILRAAVEMNNPVRWQ